MENRRDFEDPAIRQAFFWAKDQTAPLTTAYTALFKSRAIALDPRRQNGSHEARRGIAHLLMLLLFLFDPNNPCIKIMERFLGSEEHLAGVWRSKASGILDEEEYNLVLLGSS